MKKSLYNNISLRDEIINTVSKYDGVQLYGSFLYGQETYMKLNSNYYLLSDVDISISNGKENVLDLLKIELYKIMDTLKIDVSPISNFTNTIQRLQRQPITETLFNYVAIKEDIDEAICIRLFYSYLDVYDALINNDRYSLFYCYIRCICEISMYLCWEEGIICGNYLNRLQYISKKLYQIYKCNDYYEICNCTFIKCGIVSLDKLYLTLELIRDSIYRIYSKIIYYIFDRYNSKSYFLNEMLSMSINDNMINKSFVMKAWLYYSENIEDATRRNIYLKNRLNAIMNSNIRIYDNQQTGILHSKIPEYYLDKII